MHPAVGAVLAVHVAAVQVVDVVTVQHRGVPAPRAVGVAVLLRLLVLGCGHDAPLPVDSLLICVHANVKISQSLAIISSAAKTLC